LLIYSLCDIITYDDVEYLIAGKTSEMHEGILINKYLLQPQSSFRQNLIYNIKLVGSSIEGRVLAVKGDKVRLHLSIDQQQNVETAYWFNYDTIYVAEGHTGVYIMPEPGTISHLYFPGREEQRAYIRPMLRNYELRNSKTGNPNVKYFETIDANELKLSPDTLSLSAKNGRMSITMAEGGGISCVCKGDLTVQGTNIKIRGERVNINSGDKISLITDGGSIMVKSKVDVRGMGGSKLIPGG